MKTLLFIGGIGMQELLLIALVILLFFWRQENSGTHEGTWQGYQVVQGRNE